ncbi:MAG: ABC transporter permease subunit [Beijerinckiaceae bacterium]|nr:ABC transporter permease subunit [Beijerinckiaceae bacterium]
MIGLTLAVAPLNPATLHQPWEAPRLNLLLGADEFGRNALLVLMVASGRSLASGGLLASLAILVALVFAAAMVRVRGTAATLITQALVVVESIPVFVWILIIFVATRERLTSGITILFLIAVTPFAANILRGEFLRLLDQPFIHVARMAGMSWSRIMLRHVLPNASSVALPLFAQLLGLGLAIPGAIGILGFTNRTDLDLGVMLFRGKENVVDHPLLLISTIGGILLIYACILQVTRRENWSPEVTQTRAG